MTDRLDSFFKALREKPRFGSKTYRGVPVEDYVKFRQEQEAMNRDLNERWLAQQGITRGTQTGARLFGAPEPYTVGSTEETVLGPPTATPEAERWRSMPWSQRFQRAFRGDEKQQEWVKNLPEYYIREYQRLIPMGDIPVRDKHGRIVEWKPREEWEQKVSPMDPIEQAAADPLLAVLEAAGAPEGAAKRAGFFFGSAPLRGEHAAIMNLFRKHLKGPARKALLRRGEQGVALATTPGGLTRQGDLGNVWFNQPTTGEALNPILREAEVLAHADPKAARMLERAERTMERQRDVDRALYEEFAGPDTPPFPEKKHLTVLDIAMAGPHVPSTVAHEVFHLVEEDLPLRLKRQIQDFAEKAGKERPDIVRASEHPVYWLQAVMEGKRYPWSHQDLKKLAGKRGLPNEFKLTDEMVDAANLRASLENAGVDVMGFYNSLARLGDERARLARWRQRSAGTSMWGPQRGQMELGNYGVPQFIRQLEEEQLDPDTEYLLNFVSELTDEMTGRTPLAKKMRRR